MSADPGLIPALHFLWEGIGNQDKVSLIHSLGFLMGLPPSEDPGEMRAEHCRQADEGVEFFKTIQMEKRAGEAVGW